MPSILDTPIMRTLLLKWTRAGFASIGFVGTSRSLSLGQRAALQDILTSINRSVGAWQFHHHGRYGSEVEAHNLASALDTRVFTVIHPVLGSGVSKFSIDATEMREKWVPTLAAKDLVSEVSLVVLAPRPTARGRISDLEGVHSEVLGQATLRLTPVIRLNPGV